MALIEKSKYFDKIAEDNYKKYLMLVSESDDVAINIYNVYSSGNLTLDKKLNKADEVITMMKLLVEKYKGIPVEQGECFTKWFSVLVTAAYIRYMCFDKEKPFVSLMYAREFTSGLAAKAKVPDNELEFILQAVESTLGVNGPQKLKAPADTPGEMLVLAILLIETEADAKTTD